jgi:NADH-quinone oxidoreductase subunit N
MQKMIKGLPSIILLQSFTVFPEYFVGISIIYVLIVIVLITYNVYGLLLQKALSECMALIMFMACYLMFNDDLITLNFCSFHNSIVSDYLSYITKFVICLSSGLYFLLISDSLKAQRLTSFEYLLIMLFSILGLMLMCSSSDLLTAYLSIELSSLALYILASFKKTSSYSVESGLKYFITGAISSSFFLLGSSFLYLTSGSIYFSDFILIYDSPYLYLEPGEFAHPETFSSVWGKYDMAFIRFNYILYLRYFWYIHPDQDPYFIHFDYSIVEVGFTFILFGLFIKLASAPFHLWSLDVYEGSPTSSSFFFAAITKLSTFVLIIRTTFINFHSVCDGWQFYFFWVGVFSVFIGAFGGLKQRKIKTLLAYSSITNMGYALLALGAGTSFGVQMLFFHLIIYMISGLCTWSILLLLRLKTRKLSKKYNKELCDLALLRKSNPALAFAFSLAMFSIAGIPPMVGFLAKMGVFLSAISMNFYIFVVASAICSVVATFYYIRIIKILYFENLLVGKLYYPIDHNKTLIISFLIFLLLFLFVNPSLIYILSLKLIPFDFQSVSTFN